MNANPVTMDLQLSIDEWLHTIGSALRGLRLQQNLGQVELAERAGVARSAVQNLESGRATLSTLVRVVRALGREDWLRALAAETSIHPLYPRAPHTRQRASGGRRGKPEEPR